MSSSLYWILALLLFLHFPGISLLAASASPSSSSARRLLSNGSILSNPPSTRTASLSSPPSETLTSPSADSCYADCSSHALPHSKTLTITVVGIFIACVLLAFISVYARRYCVPDVNLHANYYTIERINEVCRVNEALMRALPVVKYGAAGDEEGCKKMMKECAVCLSEFEKGEMLRLLPACNHLFHKDCIDMWLFSHTTCPLCRVSLLRHKKDPDVMSDRHPLATNTEPMLPPIRSPTVTTTTA